MRYSDSTWTDTTDSTANITRLYLTGHICRIRRVHAKGSNGLVRREYGECLDCGKPYRRVIRWDTKDAHSWWEAA